MKHVTLLRVGLLWCILVSCKPDPAPIMDNDLSGNWTGNYQTQQIGPCRWVGTTPSTTATFMVTNGTVTATITQTVGQNKSTDRLTGTITGNTVRLNQTTNATCDGIPRTYTRRFEGAVQSNTLNLISRDTLCPVPGCIFLRTLKLTRQ